LSGCSSRYVKTPTHSSYRTKHHTKQKHTLSVKSALYREYKKWKNTPYRYGGNSLRGVDCSSLVQQIYRDALNIRVPRTTKQQAKAGYWVARKRVKEGDLVLFKTGYNTRHSGIYLTNGNFINSSTSNGVTISNLNNPYWRSKYWQSRRVFP
jgi:lipoprotein Spr/probable lipoprotein NlpC